MPEMRALGSTFWQCHGQRAHACPSMHHLAVAGPSDLDGAIVARRQIHSRRRAFPTTVACKVASNRALRSGSVQTRNNVCASLHAYQSLSGCLPSLDTHLPHM